MIATKPLKQRSFTYQPLILGSKKVNKTHLILASILRKWIKKVDNGGIRWISQAGTVILIIQ